MATEIDRVLASLPHLTAAELERVRAAVAALRQFGGSTAPAAPSADQPDTDDDLVLDIIIQCLSKHGISNVFREVYKRSKSYPSFKRKVPGVMEYLAKASKNTAHQRAILQMGVDLLYKYLTSRGLPTTGTTMMNFIMSVPVLMAHEFPGYLESGLLHMLVE